MYGFVPQFFESFNKNKNKVLLLALFAWFQKNTVTYSNNVLVIVGCGVFFWGGGGGFCLLVCFLQKCYWTRSKMFYSKPSIFIIIQLYQPPPFLTQVNTCTHTNQYRSAHTLIFTHWLTPTHTHFQHTCAHTSFRQWKHLASIFWLDGTKHIIQGVQTVGFLWTHFSRLCFNAIPVLQRCCLFGLGPKLKNTKKLWYRQHHQKNKKGKWKFLPFSNNWKHALRCQL